MSGSEWTSHVPIDCVSVQSCQCGADEACKYVQEIERLREVMRRVANELGRENEGLVEMIREALGE